MHQTPGYQQQPYDHPPQPQWQQQPPPQPQPPTFTPPTHPTPPAPTPPPSRRKPGSKAPLFIVIAIVVLAAIGAAVFFLTGGDDTAPEAKPAKSAAARTAETLPTPNAGERAVYLESLRAISPELAANEDRAIRQGGLVCQRILKPDEGGMSLPQYTVAELSKGDTAITRVQAFKVIVAVKAWCGKS
ncbi:hypothetical protein [Microtetraspora niveoalba]|uniref:hypothetical protein n=1 Tax=Microtetraspora niveoalba TaxID=46175 RepID=UPI0008365575|nr:hypothetical protein [Microtetraspora niveoalba]